MSMILDFPSQETINGQAVTRPRSRRDYLGLLKRFLTLDDYMEVCTGILDEEEYRNMEPHLVKIVDCYYTFDK